MSCSSFRFYVPFAVTPKLLDEVWLRLDGIRSSPDWDRIVFCLNVSYRMNAPRYREYVGERLHRFPVRRSLNYHNRGSPLAAVMATDIGPEVKGFLEKLLAVRFQLGAGIFNNCLAHADAANKLTRSLSLFAGKNWDPTTYDYAEPEKADDTYLRYAKALASEEHLKAVEERIAA
jgi:hypothetical protein